MRPRKPFTPNTRALALLFISALFISCVQGGWNTDLVAFVETGLSIVYLDSSSYSQAGSAVNEDVASGTPVTVNLKIRNPKNIGVSYSLSCDAALITETAMPVIADTSSATDGITDVSFTFTPSELAEHGDIVFTLGMYSPTLNKSFKNDLFTVRCDSVPGPVENLVSGIRLDKRACIGLTLAEGYRDEDIAHVEISYVNTATNVSKTVTEPVSRAGTGLTAIPEPALLNSDAGLFVRYFLPDDVVPGNPYTFTVVTIDAGGKRSRLKTNPETVSVTGTEQILAYDANGGTGTVGAQFGFNGVTTTSISNAASLTNTGHNFTGWNSKADGTGTVYGVGASYTFPNADLTMYAQWLPSGSVDVTVSFGYERLTFRRNGHILTATTMDIRATLRLALENGAIMAGTSYKWYVDGIEVTDETSSFFDFKVLPPYTPGTHIVTATVNVGTTRYSRDLTVTLCDDYMVPVIHTGETETFLQGSVSSNPGLLATDSSFRNTLSGYSIGKYEVSYKLWYTVKYWAGSRGYAFANNGRPGTSGIDGEVLISSNSDQPVSALAWSDSMVWCNAYSEMMGLTPCYTYGGSVLKDSTNIAHCNGAVFTRANNGYRLPTESEWQYAASQRGAIAANEPIGGVGNEGDYSWYNNNPPYVSRIIGTIPIPNTLGLFDMTGNVWEWCFDWVAPYPAGDRVNYFNSTKVPYDTYYYHVTRGASYGSASAALVVGWRALMWLPVFPENDPSQGFRIARSLPE